MPGALETKGATMNSGRVVVVVLVCAVLLGLPFVPTVRHAIGSVLPPYWVQQINGLRFGYRVDHDVKIAMADGVKLAVSLYLPRNPKGNVGTILVRQPYSRMSYGEGLNAAKFFASHGYAVLIQDIRGKFDSGGEFIPYRSGTADGVDTLDWIVRQAWSNGRVGTWGCSGLGELQFVLARARHPAHSAMVAMGAGGAVGSLDGRYAYFGLFEGGIFQLASGFGWFLEHGAKTPGAARSHSIDMASALRGLPLADLVRRIDPAPNGYEDFVRTPLADPWWKTLDYVSASDLMTTPSLTINTWGDQTIDETLALSEYVRRTAPLESAGHQKVVIGPGTHCQHEETGLDGKFGDLQVQGAAQPYFDWYLKWFDYWLYDKGSGLAELPPYLYYMLGEHQWLTSTQWPPQEARNRRWYLTSDGHANSRRGNGKLTTTREDSIGFDEYRYDPLNPVPSRGGPVCCTGNPADRAGPVDQRDVEQRDDVLVYTSPPLDQALRIAGPLTAKLTVSSSAKDTDFVARLVHVRPDGTATNIQEGALRARFRNGIDRPMPMEPGQTTEISIRMRSIAYSIPAGHRLRLHVASSSFPRLARNLNTGGDTAEETTAIIAVNRVHHDPQHPSSVEIYILPPTR